MSSERYITAKNAYKNKSYDESFAYFEEALKEDPSNYMSIVYQGFCRAYKTTLKEPHTQELVIFIKKAFELIDEEKYKGEEYKKNSFEIIEELNLFMIHLLNMYYSKFNDEYKAYSEEKTKIENYYKYSGGQVNNKNALIAIDKMNNRYKEAMKDFKQSINLTATCFNGILIIMFNNLFKGIEIYSLDNYISLKKIIETIYSRFKSLKLEETTLLNTEKIFNFISKKVDNYEEDNKTKYWTEHSEEKTNILEKIETDKKTIEEKQKLIEELKQKRDNMSFKAIETVSAQKKREFETKLSQLDNQIASLGKFDIKAKKMLNEEKFKVQSIIKKLDNNIKMENESIKNNFDKEKMELNTKINNLENDIVNLKRDITKNEEQLKMNR